MKGLLYYTDNQCQERILLACRKQIELYKRNIPLITVSQYPINFGDVNYVLSINRSVMSMFKQIVFGIKKLKELGVTNVFMLEHDVLYHKSHFDFTPSRNDIYYFNTNVWSVDSKKGKALHYNGMRKTSGLVANIDLLLQHYKKKIRRIKIDGRFSHKLGYEPGKSIARGGVDNYDREDFKSEQPNVDIKHGNNVTKLRWKLDQYVCKEAIKDSWTITKEIPYWGSVNPFHEFIRRNS